MRPFAILPFHALLTAACALVTMHAAYTGDRPVTEEPMLVDGVGPPGGIDAMVAEAAAVVRARVTGVRRVTRGGPHRLAWSTFGLEVREVFKAHSRVRNGRIVIRLPGGDLL